MIIRQLTGADALIYKELRLQALQNNPESYLATFESEVRRSIESFASELRYAFSPPIFGYYGIFVNKKDKNGKTKEKLVGYTHLDKSYLEKQQHIAFMYNLYVDPEYRGQGLATKVFEFLLKETQEKTNVERIFLSCNRKNIPAQKLYKKLGFTEYGVKEKSVKYNGKYDDEVELVKEI
ncbi:MAG: GNAT family N-acetyltransferase [Candidatus Pacebacteria bacterium]|jgi:RimJ/RimL family protein N-acetyltransferase|nr:GNAT family N-acetyltransferase [Candidatus Paceibacterota bacterium]MBT4652711.1 GNAT family N-acetyltransferase [Candidatus Paceibacterota bacterium]MBT6755868.1 GNAT family N-acetyltransferase [Candidatus Paceibacterota bacterium]MBT6921081.1 GNAT family N-acetyltransferase [Candidatus Paceibacterota bacterium]